MKPEAKPLSPSLPALPSPPLSVACLGLAVMGHLLQGRISIVHRRGPRPPVTAWASQWPDLDTLEGWMKQDQITDTGDEWERHCIKLDSYLSRFKLPPYCRPMKPSKSTRRLRMRCPP